jgi:phosphatidate cytidylyltransferase
LSNLTTRVFVAIVGIPLILLLVLAGGFYFFAFIALVSAIALHEFYLLARAKGVRPQTWLGLLLGLLVNAVFIHGRIQLAVVGALERSGIALPWPGMAQSFLILLLLSVPLFLVIELFRNNGSAIANVSATLFGVTYVSVFLGSLVGIRELFVPADFPVYAHFQIVGPAVPDDVAATIYRWGAYTVLSILASIWLCDSAAYFAGRAFGKHKLFERVSPKKTWEGAIAGLAFAVAAFLVAKALALPFLSYSSAVVCGLIVGVFGQMGDLAESLLKRDAGVKDSSTLIPGHGGVLDRFDSLMFVSPLIYFYLDFVVF